MELFHTNLIVLCGIPGSGKSTLAQQLAKIYDAKLYSYDDISRGNRPGNSYEVHSNILLSIAEDLHNKTNIVWDDLNIRAETRTKVLEAVSDIECNKILIVMTTPLGECIRRNAGRQHRLPDWVINHIYRKYQQPTLEEGWDEILYF